jgi:DNA-binding MarR family transcriptional regulator
VLAFLATQDGLTVGALAEATMTEQSTLSRSLRSLEQQGYAARRASAVDSRVVHVHLNDQGRAVFEEMLEKALRVEAASTEGVSAEELELVRSVLLCIISNLHK